MTIGKIKIIVLSSLFLFFVLSCSLIRKGASPQVKSAPFVDLHAYSGIWYEIAYLPTHFQIGCRCSMLDYVYTSKKGEGIALTACIKGKNHAISVKKIKTYPVKGTHYAQHKIQVLWPFKHDYWILYVDQYYHYALTGTPNHHYLWLLSRSPTIPNHTRESILGIASQQGYNLRRLRFTSQNCSASDRRQLTRKMQQVVKHSI